MTHFLNNPPILVIVTDFKTFEGRGMNHFLLNHFSIFHTGKLFTSVIKSL